MVGAALFYGLEHQHELDARQEHLGRIRIAKQELITKMYETSQSSASKEEWKAEIHLEIRRLTHILHKASQGGYVNGENLLEALQNPQAKAEPVWGFGSALFFSFTTMATIGDEKIIEI